MILQSFLKQLRKKITKRSKKIFETAEVTTTAVENVSITSFGTSIALAIAQKAFISSLKTM